MISESGNASRKSFSVMRAVVVSRMEIIIINSNKIKTTIKENKLFFSFSFSHFFLSICASYRVSLL